MKCILPGQNAMVFARAIQAFARIGTELYIEGQSDGLSIRTVNRTKSAFALMLFQTDFFISYDLETSLESLGSQSEKITTPTNSSNVLDHEFDNKCKISIKACLTAFKNMKQVEQCKISLDSINFKLIIELKCRLDTIKTHFVSILEQEALQAVYTKENVPNSLTGNYKLFDDIVSNFQSNEEELTIEVNCDKMIVKNYIEGSHVDSRYMRSQLSLRSDEFESYLITKPTSITFSLRELRAMLGFADALNIDISINFETTGQPVVFILKNTELFEANLVMSTLSPDITNECNDEPMDTNAITETTTIDTAPPPPVNKKKSSTLVANNSSPVVVDNCLVDLTLLSPTKQIDKPQKSPTKTVSSSPSPAVVFNLNRKKIENIKKNKTKTNRILSDDEEDFNNPSVLSINTKTNINTNSAELTNNKEPQSVNAAPEDIQVLFCDESESLLADLPMEHESQNVDADLESIPPSPPAKQRRLRNRQIFRRCFESTFDPRNLPGASQILAPSSDTEDN